MASNREAGAKVVYTTTEYAGVRRYETAKGRRYEAQWRDVAGRIKTRGGFSTKNAAKNHRDKMAGAKAEGRSTETSKLTYSQWFDKWFSVHAGTIETQSADDMAGLHRRHINPVIGHLRLVDMTPTDVKGVLAKMTKLSPRYQQMTKRQISQVLKAALAEPVPGLAGNVAADVKTPKIQASDAPAHALTVDQVETLVKAAPEWLRPVLRLLAYGGLRPSELMGLTRKSFDPATGKLTIAGTVRELRNDDGKGSTLVRKATTKTRKSRTIKLRAALVTELTERCKNLTPNAPLFSGKRGGNDDGLLRLTTIRAAFNTAKARAGDDFAEWPTPYTMRHTCATILAGENVPVHVAAKYMGHDPVEFLRTYADVFDKDMDGVAAAIDAAFNKAVGE